MQQIQARVELTGIYLERPLEILPRRLLLIERQQGSAAIVERIGAARCQCQCASERDQRLVGLAQA